MKKILLCITIFIFLQAAENATFNYGELSVDAKFEFFKAMIAPAKSFNELTKLINNFSSLDKNNYQLTHDRIKYPLFQQAIKEQKEKIVLTQAQEMANDWLIKVDLFKNGPDALTSSGIPVLCEAARNQAPILVELLLQAGANPNIKDRKGKTPLMYAVIAKQGRKGTVIYNEIISLLVEYKADINAQDDKGKSVLEYASYPSTEKYLKSLGAHK